MTLAEIGRRRPAARRGGSVPRRLAASAVGLLVALGTALPLAAQDDAPRITVTWRGAPVQEVLLTLADVSSRSIVLGVGVAGAVTAVIGDQPWDAVLDVVAVSQGLVISETPSGILRVDAADVIRAREVLEEVVTRSYRLSFLLAEEARATLEPLLSERGVITAATATNAVVVSDVPRVHATIAALLRGGS